MTYFISMDTNFGGGVIFEKLFIPVMVLNTGFKLCLTLCLTSTFTHSTTVHHSHQTAFQAYAFSCRDYIKEGGGWVHNGFKNQIFVCKFTSNPCDNPGDPEIKFYKYARKLMNEYW